MNDAKGGTYSLMVFTKLDRLARSNRKILNILHQLKGLNVSINCIAEPSIGADSITGEILVNILGLTAQIERRMILDRTRSGRIARYREGKITQNVCPYGFKWDNKSKTIKVDSRYPTETWINKNRIIQSRKLFRPDIQRGDYDCFMQYTIFWRYSETVGGGTIYTFFVLRIFCIFVIG